MYKRIADLWNKYWMLIFTVGIVTVYFCAWNYRNLLGLLPKHDGLHGITAFATSMHSIRMQGEIAWWCPADANIGGWTQYYSGFFSPLAPTYGSILFIGATCITKLCSFLSIVIPEYPLYILLNFYITPILTIFFLFKFASIFLEHKCSYILLGGGISYQGLVCKLIHGIIGKINFFCGYFCTVLLDY